MTKNNSTTRLSFLDAAFYSLMVGAGETYLVAFALELGVSERSTAVLAILPLTMGAALQLTSSFFTRIVGSRRLWVVICSVLQAVAVGMTASAAIDLHVDQRYAILFCSATLYWAAGFSAGPSWNVWISQIVDSSSQMSFFMWRNVIIQVCTLLGLGLAGLFLQQAEANKTALVFIMIFILSAIARIASSYFLWRHPDSDSPMTPQEILPPLFHWLKKPLVAYCFAFTFLLQCSVHISAPFFAPYMLNKLNFSILEYTELLGIALVARMSVGYVFRKTNRKYGVQSMFVAGCIMIAPIPFLWTLGDHFYYLLMLQILSGLAWGAYEIGLLLFLMQTITHDERSRLLTWNNLTSALGMALGVLLGWFLAQVSNPEKETYHFLFTLSSGARVLPLCLIGGFVYAIKPGKIYFRILGIRATGSAIMKPLLARKESSK